MTDLVAWLRARLDDDAEWADFAGCRDEHVGVTMSPDCRDRVRADVAAKRAIVDEAAAAFAAREERMTGTEIRQNEGERYAFTLTLRHLAYAYHVAGAEGWREDWRP